MQQILFIDLKELIGVFNPLHEKARVISKLPLAWLTIISIVPTKPLARIDRSTIPKNPCSTSA